MKTKYYLLLFILISTKTAFGQRWGGTLRGFAIRTEFAYMPPILKVTEKIDSSDQSIKNKYKNATTFLSPKLMLSYRLGWALSLGAGIGYESVVIKSVRQSYIPLFIQGDIYFPPYASKVLRFLAVRYGYSSIIKSDNSVFTKGKSMLDINLGAQYILNNNFQFNLFVGFGLRRFSSENDILNNKINKTYSYPQLNLGLGVDFSIFKNDGKPWGPKKGLPRF